jgi:hypothetical protein
MITQPFVNPYQKPNNGHAYSNQLIQVKVSPTRLMFKSAPRGSGIDRC